MENYLNLRFGANCPPIADQLHEQGFNYTPAEILIMQQGIDHVTFLRIHSILPLAAAKAAEKKIFTRIAKDIAMHAEKAKN